MNPEAFFQQLNARGNPMGVRFGPQSLLSNSRKAMECGEFAKQHGRFEAYHDAVFHAFFTDGQNIGDQGVLLAIARAIGLDTVELSTALDSGLYLPRVRETTVEAQGLGIRSVPTFIIEDYGTVTGAQPTDTFRNILHKVENIKP